MGWGSYFVPWVAGTLLAMGTALGPVSAESCVPAVGSCDYYLCKENRQGCGSEGYHLRFGHPYCSRFFNEVSPLLTREGQDWLQRVAYCLQSDLELYSADADPCWFTEHLAIGVHAECYVKTGACALPSEDLAIVVSTFWSEFADARIFRQGLEFVAACFPEDLAQVRPGFQSSSPASARAKAGTPRP